MKIISTSLLFLLLAYATLSQSTEECRWTDSTTNLDYDYCSLWKKEGYKVLDTTTSDEDHLFHIYYSFNFGGLVNSSCGNNDLEVAVFQSMEVNNMDTDLCQAFGRKKNKYVTARDFAGSPGLQIIYPDGDPCYTSPNPIEKSNPKKTVFSLICGPSYHSEFIQLPYNDVSRTVCSPEFVIHHPAGCVGGVYGETMKMGTWLVAVFVVYVVIGVLYNVRVNQKSGIEAFPNYSLWKKAGEAMYKVPGVAKNLGEKAIRFYKSGVGAEDSSKGLSHGEQVAKYTVV